MTRHLRGRARPRRERRRLLAEAPLAIGIAGGPCYLLMRTPGADRELALGFLFSEGIILGREEVLTLADCPDERDAIRARLAPEALRRAEPRNLAVRSSCGACGRGRFEEMLAGLRPVRSRLRVPPAALYALPGRVRRRQRLFRATGASHAAAFFDAAGRILVLREDLGRHNALDKLLGWALLADAVPGRYGVFLSGRTSLEMLVKAARAGVALVAAASAPTAAAVAAARRLGITLCGFVRGREVTVYSHPRRLAPTGAPRPRGR